MSPRALPMITTTLASVAMIAVAHGDPLHADPLGASTLSTDDALGAARSPRPAVDAIVFGAPRASGLHAAASAVFMDWPLLAGVRLNGMQISPLRLDWREAAASQRPNALALSNRAAESTTVVLFDAGDRAMLSDTRGPSLAAASLAALDAQLAQLRAGIARARPAPQASLGVRVRF